MCYLSVQCSCFHNIAIPNPTKKCIRPRNPRGCWIIRRGKPIPERCPGCEEYFNPTEQQPSWKDVLSCHLDSSVDWSEVSHGNIIAADRNRHRACESDRLDLLRRLRWKTLCAHGLLAGWKLTNTGIMYRIDDGDADDEDDEDEDEIMEDAKELAEIVSERSKLFGQRAQKLREQGSGRDDVPNASDLAMEDEYDFGYMLKRVGGSGSTEDEEKAGSDESIGDDEEDHDALFNISTGSGSYSSDSDSGSELLSNEGDHGNGSTGFQSDGSNGENTIKSLEEILREEDITQPLIMPSPNMDIDMEMDGKSPEISLASSDNILGDPVKRSMFTNVPLEDNAQKAENSHKSGSPVAAILAPRALSDQNGVTPMQRLILNNTIEQMRLAREAYALASQTPRDLPTRPATPNPFSDRHRIFLNEDSDEGGSEKA